jgi:hypothetical protein
MEEMYHAIIYQNKERAAMLISDGADFKARQVSGLRRNVM